MQQLFFHLRHRDSRTCGRAPAPAARSRASGIRLHVCYVDAPNDFGYIFA